MSSGFTVLVSHLTPTLGLERSAIRLAEQFREEAAVVCLAQDAGELQPLSLEHEIRATTLGSPVRGVRRLVTVGRARRWLAHASGVVVVAGVWAAVPLLLVKRKSDPVTVIVWEHSLTDSNIAARMKLRLLAVVAGRLYRRAEAVVCVSAPLAERMRAVLGSGQVSVIPNFFELRRGLPAVHSPVPDARNGPARSRRTLARLLTVGRLVPVKNTRLVLDAFASLGDDFELIVAGDGPLREDLERHASILGVQDRVRFVGFVDDVRPLYEWCDIVVLASREETFGLVMFEAAAQHRPVVSTDFAVARQFIPRYAPGVLAEPSSEALSAAIRRAAEDPPAPEDFDRADEMRRTEFAPEGTRAMWRGLIEAVAP